MSVNNSIVVIGSGSYGTALAIVLAQHNNEVILWGHNASHVNQLKLDRYNKNYLPDIKFPPTLQLETSLSLVLAKCRNIIIVVPSYAFNNIIKQIKVYLRPDARIVWATKGLEHKSGKLLQDVVTEILGKTIPLAIISGPTFAYELAVGKPTAIVIATNNIDFGIYLQFILSHIKNLYVYMNDDFIGVQISGVIKNIIAIGVGISDGINLGANIRTVLITYGMAEMSRLGIAIGAKFNTFLGIAGLGDLILSSTDDRSRNRRFGIFIGQGIDIKTAQKNIGQIIEGYDNIKEVWILAKRYKVNMPITEQVYQILYQNRPAKDIALIINKICVNKNNLVF